MKKQLLLWIMALAISQLSLSQNNGLEGIHTLEEFVAAAKKKAWKEAKQKNGITISYRKLELFDTISTRELRVTFKVPGPVNSILSQIRQPDKLKSWNDGVRSAALLKNHDTDWVLHTVYKIPWPFSQQDLVASYTIAKKRDTITIASKSLPDYIKPIKGVTREGYNLSQWLVIPGEQGLFEIRFSAISITNSSIPRWIKDPLIQRMLLRSFGKFKNKLP